MMGVADEDYRDFAIAHSHGLGAWGPKETGAITTIEKLKASSMRTSTKSVLLQRLSSPWSPKEVLIYALPTDYVTFGDTHAAQRFSDLADEWESETAFTSALDEMVLHQHYQEIIGMGMSALPFIFERLPESPARWFWALRAIVGHDVAADSTSSAQATQHWLDWGIANGYVTQ
jgi:hypothetical protein